MAPELWAGWKPNGIGELKPNHYMEIAETLWDNRRALPYALRILRNGVCDGCALGVSGFHDWTIDGVHLCTTRLSLLRFNTARPLDHERLADVASLRHDERRRAARPGPARLPDGPPARRARLPPGVLGRGARPGRRDASGAQVRTGSPST